MELSPVVDNPTPTNRRGLLLGLALLLLISGISLGAIASNLFPRSPLPVTESSPVIPPVEEPITPPKEVTKTVCVDGFKYRVRSGDSLSRIAKRFYGDESLLSPILEANPFLLDRLDSLEVGEKLFIPNTDKSC
jgi:LysM repeat protein